jgi:uncharacterized protein
MSKKENCGQCYSCQQGVSSDVTVDDVKSGKVKLPEAKCQQCEDCYSCQQGVSSDVTKEKMLEERAKRCEKCYSCQQGVSPDITVDTPKDEKGSKVLTVGGMGKDVQCRQCYRCEQGISKSVTADDMKSQTTMPFCWYIFPTNGCNLRCKYCYANNKPGNMTRETMHETLRWLFTEQPHKNLTCHFFGGEPTLRWDTLVDMVHLGTEMAKNNGYKVGWSMTTNGTMLTTERLDWLGKNFKPNPFLLSIDGRPKTHDKYRVYESGKGSHHMIPVDEILSRFPNIECRPTIKPDTARDWFEDFRWLRNKGFKSIAIEPDYECEWSSKQLEDYRRMLQQLGKYYVYAYRLNKPIRMKFIDGVLGEIGNPSPPGGRMCGVAWNCGAIDHRGHLYACQRYASYNDPEKYSIGHVNTGWDEFKLFETQLLFRENVRGDISKGFNCQTCEIRQFCMKGCNAANCKLSGSREVTHPMVCTMTKIEVSVALEVLAELGLLTRKQGTKSQSCRC